MPVIKDYSTTFRKIEIQLDRREILEMFQKWWPALKVGLPNDNIRIYFTVPSGGDWSGQDVEIDSENPIRIYIERQEGKD